MLHLLFLYSFYWIFSKTILNRLNYYLNHINFDTNSPKFEFCVTYNIFNFTIRYSHLMY